MRDRLAHRYFDTTHAVVQATVDHDLPELPSSSRTEPATDGDDPRASTTTGLAAYLDEELSAGWRANPARRALGLDGSPGSALCPGAGLGTPLPGDRLRR